MGRKKRRWRKWKAKRQGLVNPSLGRLVAWADWVEEE